MKKQIPVDSLVVGYIMKGYPRISETFILNEIYLLENMGMQLHVFSVKGSDSPERHDTFARIRAKLTYTPEEKAEEETTFRAWLAKYFLLYLGSHLRLMLRRPKTYVQALFYTLFGLSLSVSLGKWPYWKRTFMKDFLRAGYIALQVLQYGRIGHLHGHFCHGSTTMTMLVSHITGIPYSFTAHAKDIYLPKLNPGKLLPLKIERAQFVATCTGANRAYLDKLNDSPTPIYTIYHGVDMKRFQPPERAKEDPTTPTILAVGRLVEKKGFDYLVRACHMLQEQGIDFHCRIVGEPGDHLETIQELIRQLGIEERITLQGAVTQTELRDIYAAATAFALPCHIANNGDRDGIPNVLVEAMAMGLPVVSTNISGIPELIDHGSNGLLVPPKDVVALAAALGELLANPAMRHRLGAAARQKVIHTFDSQQTTSALKALFIANLEHYRNSVVRSTNARQTVHLSTTEDRL